MNLSHGFCLGLCIHGYAIDGFHDFMSARYHVFQLFTSGIGNLRSLIYSGNGPSNQYRGRLRCLCAFGCQVADFISNHSKSFACCAGAGCLNCSIQSKDVSLEGNIFNGFDNFLNLIGTVGNLSHSSYHFLHFLVSLSKLTAHPFSLFPGMLDIFGSLSDTVCYRGHGILQFFHSARLFHRTLA